MEWHEALTLVWQRLLRQPLALGDVVADELHIVGESGLRARVRGQVVALGPLRIAGRPLDAAVIELFGDVPQGETSTGLDGSLVVDAGVYRGSHLFALRVKGDSMKAAAILDGDLVRRVRQCGQAINHVHTAGNPGRGELDKNQEINYPPVMKALREIGYAGYVGHEFIPTRDPLAGLRQAVKVCDV